MVIRNKLFNLFALALILLLAMGCAAGQTPPAAPTASLAPTAVVPPTAIPTATLAPTPTSVFVNGTGGQPWWNDTTFYEIFVRSFYDANGDGKGDFNGLTAKLDYLTSLGIKGIWLMPINPSPSYHGYDVTDYYGINPDYGTMDDFKNFLNQAHQRGIRVIMDLVLNHTSSQNPWFVKSQDPTSKYRNWYIWSTQNPAANDPAVTKYWHNIPGSGYYYGYFTAEMPDLNYKNPEVTAEMENVVKFWLNLGIDGFRLDAAKYLIEDGDKIEDTQGTHDWFKAFRPIYKAINPQALTVGEIWSSSYTVLSYTLGDQLDLGFDFDLAKSWVSSTISGDGMSLRNSTVGEESIFKNGQVATFLTNHDQDRVMSQFGLDVNKAKAAATILLTSPGVPFIYYGEEVGMEGSGSDPNKRTPMQWTADTTSAGFTSGKPWEGVGFNTADMNVAVEDKDPNSLLNHYRTLIRLRSQTPALRVGDLVNVDASSNAVYASLRTLDGQAVLTLINLGDAPLSDLKLGFSGSSLKGTYQAKALFGNAIAAPLQVSDSGDVVDYAPLTELPAHAILILSYSK